MRRYMGRPRNMRDRPGRMAAITALNIGRRKRRGRPGRAPGHTATRPSPPVGSGLDLLHPHHFRHIVAEHRLDAMLQRGAG
jgi:hypothetical protein